MNGKTTVHTRLLRNDEGVYELILHRPRVLNAVNVQMIKEILHALARIKEKGDCRVLIVSGSGRAFSVGADTSEAERMSEEQYGEFLRQFSQMLLAVKQFPAPVIAKVSGYAFGGGAELTCVCDVRFGDTGTTFRFPGVSYGILVGAATLSTIVSLPKAKELLFASSIVEAEEAYRIGLLNQLVADSLLDEYTLTYARTIVENPKVPVEVAKEALNRMIGLTKSERKKVEKDANTYLMQHTQQRETFSAFAKKRKKKVEEKE